MPHELTALFFDLKRHHLLSGVASTRMMAATEVNLSSAPSSQPKTEKD
jgi:hypothetical protein